MKKLLSIIFIILGFILNGQEFVTLEKVSKNAKSPVKESIIYGDFIQRLGFSSGGFPQDMYIKNLESEKFYRFRAKPTYKSRKDNTFCFYIPPGEYVIYSYFWTQSKWYGGNWHGEPIFEGIDLSEFDEGEEIVVSEKMDDDSVRYIFKVKEKSINYLGTWHFDNINIHFTNDKV
jgi:hypothetical protein